MRLSDEQIYEFKQIYAIRGKYRLHLDDDYILVSVKRANDLLDTIEALQQATRDAKNGEIPIVAHRKNGEKWKVTMWASDWFKLYREWQAGEWLKEKAEELKEAGNVGLGGDLR